MSLIGTAGRSERSFSRRYAEAAGQTPARAIERLRVKAARRLLSESRLPTKRIAQRFGLGAEETLRRTFTRLLSVSPQNYRARFTSECRDGRAGNKRKKDSSFLKKRSKKLLLFGARPHSFPQPRNRTKPPD